MVFLFVLSVSATSYAGKTCNSFFANSGKVLVATIVSDKSKTSGKEVVVADTKAQNDLMRSTNEQWFKQYKKLKQNLLRQAETQGRQLVNSNRIKRTRINKKTYDALKQIHKALGARNSKDSLVSIDTNLSYFESTATKDVKSGQKVIAHKYIKVISETTRIYAILIQENTPHGTRLDRLVIRIETKDKKGNQEILDIPYMYNAFGIYYAHDTNMQLKDEGIHSVYSAKLIFKDSPAEGMLAGTKIEIKNSFVSFDPTDVLHFKLFVSKNEDPRL